MKTSILWQRHSCFHTSLQTVLPLAKCDFWYARGGVREVPPTHHKSVILTHIFSKFSHGFSFITALPTSVSVVWVCANAGICFSYFFRSPGLEPCPATCTGSWQGFMLKNVWQDLTGSENIWQRIELMWSLRLQGVSIGPYWPSLTSDISAWLVQVIHLNLVRNEWCVWGAAGGAGIPDLRVMFSGVYFRNRSLCFDLIGFDSTTNGAGVGDVQKYMLSEWSSISTSMAQKWKWSQWRANSRLILAVESNSTRRQTGG